MLYVIGLIVVILMVALGLGFVIFVHELGHFLVAKMCGVKCEKFYLGFDIGGLKICRFRWGETEYGIGILPFGGYVKMLGQEDNPSKLREEIDRAKAAGADNSQGQQNPGSQPPVSPAYDPRSFLAQSVPKRMAIISAGVIMNVIFAYLMAVVAFWIGVEQMPCIVGQVYPGESAWQADIRSDDVILEIAGKKMHQFRDLQTAISLGDIDAEKGVPLLIRRPGEDQPKTIVVKPNNLRGVFYIGVTNGNTTRLLEDRPTWLVQKQLPTVPGMPASKAEPPLKNGDRIVQIDDAPIEHYGQIDAELTAKSDRKVSITVERRAKNRKEKPEHVTTAVESNPMRHLGLVMKMGPVAAVQADSPAAAADIRADDVIKSIDGREDFDPMMLPDQLARRAGETIKLTVERKDAKEPLVKTVKLRKSLGFTTPVMFDGPLGVSSLGIAYKVQNEVASVTEGGPAAAAGVKPGDVVAEALAIPPAKQATTEDETPQTEEKLEFDEKNHNWPIFMYVLQGLSPETTVKLTYQRDGKKHTTAMNPVMARDWFRPDRGLRFEPMVFDRTASSVAEAFSLGGNETISALTIVFRSLHKLGTNQVSPRNLMGPWWIVKLALQKADQGAASLLLFLTMLSANLAVLNFLPIPLLDGGLLMFLIYELIRRKPANEHVQVVLTYIGLAFIIALMVWVLGLDFGFISRR